MTIGIVFKKPENEIIAIILDVIDYTETDIIGKSSQIKGINLEQMSFVIVDPISIDITYENVNREYNDVEIVDDIPVIVPKIEVIGQKEIIKVILEENGIAIGIGDVFSLENNAVLDWYKSQKDILLKQQCAIFIMSPFTLPFNDHVYKLDLIDQSNLNGTKTWMRDHPEETEIDWEIYDSGYSVVIKHTPEEITALTDFLYMRVKDSIIKRKTLWEQVKVAESKEAIDNINW